VPIVVELGPGKLVVSLPAVPLKLVSDTGEMVLLDAGVVESRVPDVDGL
jgi:hypothetical protein